MTTDISVLQMKGWLIEKFYAYKGERSGLVTMMIQGRRLIKKDIAFKNPDVKFISFGHPVFEALLGWAKRNYFAKLQ